VKNAGTVLEINRKSTVSDCMLLAYHAPTLFLINSSWRSTRSLPLATVICALLLQRLMFMNEQLEQRHGANSPAMFRKPAQRAPLMR
jgi:hypothetical protein